MNTKPEEKKKFSLINFWSVIAILGTMAGIAAIVLPSFLCQANRSLQTEAKQTLSAMNKSQQAYYTENNRFMTTMADFMANSGAGVKTQTVNYTYDVVAADYSNNVVNLATPRQGAKYLAYAGGVGLVTPTGTTVKTSTTVLCESKTKGAIPTASAVVFTPTEVKCNGVDFVDAK